MKRIGFLYEKIYNMDNLNIKYIKPLRPYLSNYYNNNIRRNKNMNVCKNISSNIYPKKTYTKEKVYVPFDIKEVIKDKETIYEYSEQEFNIAEYTESVQNDMNQYMITQNRLQLSSTYSADQSKFKIDVAVMEGREFEVELDYDLLSLIKHNVLVGKDNYDRVKMEEVIDFYVVLGKIDWDMWDELWLLIEYQHNPSPELEE